jgi:hypothetical protein
MFGGASQGQTEKKRRKTVVVKPVVAVTESECKMSFANDTDIVSAAGVTEAITENTEFETVIVIGPGVIEAEVTVTTNAQISAITSEVLLVGNVPIQRPPTHTKPVAGRNLTP